MALQEQYTHNNKNNIKNNQTKQDDIDNNARRALKHNNNSTANMIKVLTMQKMKIAALSIRLKAELRSADMPFTLQERALCFTRSFVDASTAGGGGGSGRIKPSQLAFALKKEFDTRYGAAWHCIVGKSYGSYVTHSAGGFLYFLIDSYFVLLFKTQVQLLDTSS